MNIKVLHKTVVIIVSYRNLIVIICYCIYSNLTNNLVLYLLHNSVTNKTDFETSPTQTTVHLGNVNQCGDTGENKRAECVGAADGTWGWKFTLTNNTDCDADVSTNVRLEQ